jgi:hypothetical protein
VNTAANDLQLRELKRLCEQAEHLRRDAEKLCKQINAQLERSLALHGSPATRRRNKR